MPVKKQMSAAKLTGLKGGRIPATVCLSVTVYLTSNTAAKCKAMFSVCN